MEATGICINSRGGAYKIGKARPLQDKAAIAHKYFELDGGESVSRTTVMLTLLHFPNQTISSLFPDMYKEAIALSWEAGNCFLLFLLYQMYVLGA